MKQILRPPALFGLLWGLWACNGGDEPRAFVDAAAAPLSLPQQLGVPAPSPGPPICEMGAAIDARESRAPIAAFVAASGISRSYLRNCAGCHGDSGKGLPGYGGVRGVRTLTEFSRIVREGRGKMPAFAPQLGPLMATAAGMCSLTTAPSACTPYVALTIAPT